MILLNALLVWVVAEAFAPRLAGPQRTRLRSVPLLFEDARPFIVKGSAADVLEVSTMSELDEVVAKMSNGPLSEYSARCSVSIIQHLSVYIRLVQCRMCVYIPRAVQRV